MPEDQRREMRRAFYGAWGQLLFCMRDDMAGIPEPEAVIVLARFQKQVSDFWGNEVVDQEANKQKFKDVDPGSWEQDVLKAAIFMGTNPPVTLIKKPDDPICARASCGGNEKQMYITYRGSLAAVEKVLKNCLKTITHALIKENQHNQ